MSNTVLHLSRDELFKAISEYVNNHYPNLNTEQASIKRDRLGIITHVEVECTIEKM